MWTSSLVEYPKDLWLKRDVDAITLRVRQVVYFDIDLAHALNSGEEVLA